MNRKPYLVLGTVNIDTVHVDHEHGTTYEPFAEYENKTYTMDAETPEEARWQAAIEALGKHVKTGDLEKDASLSLPHIGHGRYTIFSGGLLYTFQGIAFERASE